MYKFDEWLSSAPCEFIYVKDDGNIISIDFIVSTLEEE